MRTALLMIAMLALVAIPTVSAAPDLSNCDEGVKIYTGCTYCYHTETHADGSITCKEWRQSGVLRITS